jgi:ribosomal protein S12 methylthiotransferase accessory factor
VVHTNYTLPLPTGSGCFPASSNGLASGNHLLEAINHGICEVIERDAVAVWDHLDKARRERTRLDLGTVDDHDCADILERLERAGFAVGVWDATTDVGIASFYCLVTDRRQENAHSGAGAGTHPARAIALLRALTEAIQVRTTYISGSRDDRRPAEFTAPALEQKLRRARGLMAGPAAQRDFRHVPSHEAATCADDLDWMLDRLRVAGIAEVVTFDLTGPEVGVPVVRVVIPGLEGPDDHDTYVPGPRARRFVGGRR